MKSNLLNPLRPVVISVSVLNSAEFVYLTPGAVDVMRSRICTRMKGFTILDGAGHWLQDEQPEAVCNALVSFLRNTTDPSLRKKRQSDNEQREVASLNALDALDHRDRRHPGVFVSIRMRNSKKHV